jgi:hypothetical protein
MDTHMDSTNQDVEHDFNNIKEVDTTSIIQKCEKMTAIETNTEA